MIALLDINMLIALFDGAHVHHKAAHAWMAKNRFHGWATCPITQNGCVRVMSQPNYPGSLPVAEVIRRLSRAISAPQHRFWPDSISLCDSAYFEPNCILTPKMLTDVYLLGLAVKRSARLVTFDRTVPSAAVAGAKTRHLLML
jgi:toxin-antitoxin system PIN domain toxin